MSKVVRIHRLGGPEVLELEDVEVGAPGAGEVRLKVEAIGLNRSEAMFRQGNYPQKPQLPTGIGYEGVGVIEAVGPGVQGFEVGQRVCVVPNFHQGAYGLCGEKAIIPVRSLLPVPPGLSPVQAAAVWMQYCTALAIIEVGRAAPGDYVVIRAASSSVGLAAIQLANWAGAVPIAATRRSDKAAALMQLGAKHVVATEETDLVAEIMRITGGRGARLVFDPVGGPEVDKLAQAMSERGILFIYGGLSGQPTVFPHWPAALKGLSLRGWVASEIWGKPHRYARAQQLILQGLAQGHLQPVIAKTFPLAQIVAAHRYLESNQQLGKIVVTVN
jgi:NADPH:quinone reductase-like Zn-dependent oxidoreductase